MAWLRGPKIDYDDWAEAVGDEWWKWDNVLKYMKRVCHLNYPELPDLLV